MTRSEEIEAIELTEDELKLIILQGKIAKYHKLRNEAYWQELEAKRPKKEKHGKDSR
jgi:hypothetical protein